MIFNIILHYLNDCQSRGLTLEQTIADCEKIIAESIAEFNKVNKLFDKPWEIDWANVQANHAQFCRVEEMKTAQLCRTNQVDSLELAKAFCLAGGKI